MLERVPESALKVGIRLLLTVVILMILVNAVGWDLVWQALLEASWPWLVAMYTAVLAIQVLNALQLQRLLRGIGVEVRLGRAFLASQLASFYSLIVPGDLAASAAKWANLSVATGKRSLVLNALLYNKLLTMTVPAAIGAMALAIDNPFGRLWVTVLAFVIFGGLLLLMALLYSPRLGTWSERRIRWIADRFPERIALRLGFAINSLTEVRRLPGREHVLLLSFAIVGVSLGVARVFFGIEALDLGVSPFAVLWIMAFTLIARLLPITVANLGIRESLLVVALTPLGVPAEQAVALGLLGFSTIVLLAVIGGVYQITLLAGWSSRRGNSRQGDN